LLLHEEVEVCNLPILIIADSVPSVQAEALKIPISSAFSPAFKLKLFLIFCTFSKVKNIQNILSFLALQNRRVHAVLAWLTPLKTKNKKFYFCGLVVLHEVD